MVGHPSQAGQENKGKPVHDQHGEKLHLMSTYNTTTISNVFARLYNNLRRQYGQYATNFSARQYLVFANVLLTRPDRIPYYLSAQGARDKNNPAGTLPLDISGYYFIERPVFFFDRNQFMDWRVGGKSGYSLAGNPPYAILNLFINGTYQDVYINYESGKMTLDFYALDAILFVEQEKEVVALQKSLEDLLLQVVIAYNQVRILEGAQAAGKYNNQSFVSKAKNNVENWINSLQKDQRFVVKVCRECGNNAALGDIFPAVAITYITMAGAIALTWLIKSYAQYDQVAAYLEDTQVLVDRLRIELDTQWKYVNGYTGPVDSGVKPMPSVTETATIPKKADSKWWMIAVAVGLGLTFSGNSNKK
jgi:hypothetical protein